jgi:hypothetical protein
LLIFVSGLLCGPAWAQSAVTTDLQVPTQGVNLDWLTLATPVLGGLGKFHGTYGPTPNPGDPNRPDQAFTFGWNVTLDGSAELAGEPALMWRFEDYTTPGTNSFRKSSLRERAARVVGRMRSNRSRNGLRPSPAIRGAWIGQHRRSI